MREIRYQDRESDQTPYTSRLLILGDRLRMDYGQDDDDFVLFDRRLGTVWLVSHEGRRLTEIPGGVAPKTGKPKAGALQVEWMKSEANALAQVRLEGRLCAEYKVAPILQAEARLYAAFRRALAANQHAAWLATPEDLRQPCSLALDVSEAGIEYRQGLPLAIRYWDGRVRVYSGHGTYLAVPGLFELPADYSRFVVGGDQEKATRRQPAASHDR